MKLNSTLTSSFIRPTTIILTVRPESIIPGLCLLYISILCSLARKFNQHVRTRRRLERTNERVRAQLAIRQWKVSFFPRPLPKRGPYRQQSPQSDLLPPPPQAHKSTHLSQVKLGEIRLSFHLLSLSREGFPPSAPTSVASDETGSPFFFFYRFFILFLLCQEKLSLFEPDHLLQRGV